MEITNVVEHEDGGGVTVTWEMTKEEFSTLMKDAMNEAQTKMEDGDAEVETNTE